MKIIRKHTYKSIAESWLKHFRKVAKTNKFAKGKEYDMVETEKINRLGFTVTYYNIVEL